MIRFYSIIVLMKSIISSIFDRFSGSKGEILAEKLTNFLGSWKFIIVQSCILWTWMIINVILSKSSNAFDPYPFILLNLMLSFQAAFTGPIVLMSQNRQGAKDRLAMTQDLECDLRSELSLIEIKALLRRINEKL
jgi:uncharacterized membrane protein